MKSREKEAMLRVCPGRQQQQKRTVGIFRWLFPQRNMSSIDKSWAFEIEFG
jgi:hypothetical protein